MKQSCLGYLSSGLFFLSLGGRGSGTPMNSYKNTYRILFRPLTLNIQFK